MSRTRRGARTREVRETTSAGPTSAGPTMVLTTPEPV
jgi:hypothetical protein